MNLNLRLLWSRFRSRHLPRIAGGLVPNAMSYAPLRLAFTPQRLPDAAQHWMAAEAAVAPGTPTA